MELDRELVYKEFLRRENPVERTPYPLEMAFYAAIRAGDTEAIREHCREPFSGKVGMGQLSEDPLRNLKYHLAITIALLARSCIEGGLDHASAYMLSDFYIQKADLCRSADELNQLHRAVSLEYAQRMRDLRTRRIAAPRIVACVEYIYDHLHTRITVRDLAKHAGLAPSYLSRLFHKETGYTIHAFIRLRKLEAARNMLCFSDYSSAQISSFLAFPSQSYFTEIFRKETGMTPLAFRAYSFRTGT